MSLTFDLIFREEKRPPKTEPVAYCYSEICSASTYGSKPIKVNVHKSVADCPRCQHALVWRREPVVEKKAKEETSPKKKASH